MFMYVKNIMIKYLKIIVIMFLIFIGLKTIAYLMPDNIVRENINASLNQIQQEGLYPKLVYSTDTVFFGQQLDNYTDSIFLNEAYSFGDHSILKRIAGDYRISNPKATNELESLSYGIAEGGDTSPYARQWFGSISILRVLLVAFTYPEIRIISQMVFLTLLFAASMLLWQKVDRTSSIAFFTAILFGNLTVIPISINIANSFYVVLISTMVALFIYPKKCNASALMFIIGGVTCYFDLFVTPLLSYVFLMGIILVIDYKYKTHDSFIKYLLQTIKCSIGWLAGYLILWMTKWAFASIILKQNLYGDAIREMIKMSSEHTVSWAPPTKIGLIGASLLNNLLNMFPCNIIYMLIRRIGIFAVIVLVVIGISAVILLISNLRKIEKRAILSILLLVASAPYVWYIVIHTHSFVHYWMTYRLQCGTVFLLILAFGYGTNLFTIFKRKKISG